MPVDFDRKLTSLAAEILRDAVQVYDLGDIERWVVGYNPVLGWSGGDVTTGFAALTGGFAALTGTFQALGTGPDGSVSLKKVFGLEDKLPALRLPPEAELAMQARSAPVMLKLEALAEWLTVEGRQVTETDELFDQEAAEAARRIGISPDTLPFLWEYALSSGWVELEDEPSGKRTWAVIGETAWRWADRDDAGALHVWSAVFAAMLAQVLEVSASKDLRSARKLNFQGEGVVVAMTLFLSRHVGLSLDEVGQLVMDGAIGDRPSKRAKRAWDTWVGKHGDPARLLLAELTALGAVAAPQASAPIKLTPLALWTLRKQVQRDGVQVPLVPATPAEMKAAHLVLMAEGVSKAELEADCDAWVASRGAEQAARELLAFAAFSGPQPRLVAVQLARHIGIGAHRAWRDAMQRTELRGYARMALSMMASQLPESTLPLVLDPDPDDLTWVATDLLALACGDEDPDPSQIAAQFNEAVPPGQESWIFGLMSDSSHPDVVQVLTVLGRHHPDRRVAREAQRAAQLAERNQAVARATPDRSPARLAAR